MRESEREIDRHGQIGDKKENKEGRKTFIKVYNMESFRSPNKLMQLSNINWKRRRRIRKRKMELSNQPRNTTNIPQFSFPRRSKPGDELLLTSFTELTWAKSLKVFWWEYGGPYRWRMELWSAELLSVRCVKDV